MTFINMIKFRIILITLLLIAISSTINIINSVDEQVGNNNNSIDLVFSTYLGGSGRDGQGFLAFDNSGNIVIVSDTGSIDFVNEAAYQSNHGGNDLVIIKISPDGQNVLFSTFIGGTSNEYVSGMTLDSNDNIIFVGGTNSSDFPLTENAIQSYNTNETQFDNYIVKVSSDGQYILFSSYLGSSSGPPEVSIDNSDNIILVGSTDFSNHPVVDVYQEKKNLTDIFITKLNSDCEFLFSTFFGGNGADNVRSVTIDNNNNIIFSGITTSEDFPTLNSVKSTLSIRQLDNFVTKLSPNGQSVLFSTYLGGAGAQFINGLSDVICDSLDNIIVVGQTNSTDFPVVNAIQPDYGNFTDAFIIKFQSDDYSLEFSTLLGGELFDVATTVVVDASDNILISGHTLSNFFPTTENAFQTSRVDWDVFFALISVDGQTLIFSSYYCGGGGDFNSDILIDGKDIILTGSTTSLDFPTSNAIQPSFSGVFDMYLGKFEMRSQTSSTNKDNSTSGFEWIFAVVSVIIIITSRKKRKIHR